MSQATRQGRMMDDFPLSLTVIVNRAERLYGAREVVSRRPDGSIHRTTLGDCIERSKHLAAGLKELGIEEGDRRRDADVEPARAPRGVPRRSRRWAP